MNKVVFFTKFLLKLMISPLYLTGTLMLIFDGLLFVAIFIFAKPISCWIINIKIFKISEEKKEKEIKSGALMIRIIAIIGFCLIIYASYVIFSPYFYSFWSINKFQDFTNKTIQ